MKSTRSRIASLARRTYALALVVAGLSSCAPSGPGVITPTIGDRFFVAGYHPYWVGRGWADYPWDVLDQLFFFEIEVGPEGTVVSSHGWPEDWAGLLSRAEAAGVPLVPTVSMHDAEAFEQLFSSPRATARLVTELEALLGGHPGLGGLHLDFEVFQSVDIAARAGFTAFVARLARTLDRLDPSIALSVFTLAFDDDDVFNERALAELADFLVVQGYDFHHAADERAGPTAALSGRDRLNWESVVDRFLSLDVPPRKIVMAVPLFGYEWPVRSSEPGAETRGEGVVLPLAPLPDVVPELPRARARVAEHQQRRDPENGSPYYVFEDGTGWNQGWFEDAESLRAKYDFVREKGLGGVALFPLAYGDGSHWSDLRAAFSRPR